MTVIPTIRTLEYRFLSLCHAVCTKHVWWFTALMLWLNGIGKKPRSQFVKNIACRLGFKVFNLAQLVFKFGYAFGESRLFLLTGKCNAADVKQLYIDLGYCGRKFTGISKLFRSVNDFNERLKAGDCGGDFCIHESSPNVEVTGGRHDANKNDAA